MLIAETLRGLESDRTSKRAECSVQKNSSRVLSKWNPDAEKCVQNRVLDAWFHDKRPADPIRIH